MTTKHNYTYSSTFK